MIATLAVGLATGFVYALVAMGYTLVFRTTGIVNFTSGSWVVLGGLGTYWILHHWHAPYGLAVVGALVLVAGVAAVFWVAIVVPLWRRGSPDYIVLLATVIASAALGPLMDLLITPDAVTLPPWIHGFALHAQGSTISGQYVFVAVVALLVLTLVAAVLRLTIVGKRLRACAADRETARLLGVHPEWIGGLAMVATAVIGGLAGAMIAPAQTTQSGLALTYGIYAFVAAVVGGLDSITGAFLGGLLLGVAQAFTDRYYTPNFDNIIVFGLLVLVLVVRPTGLLGKAAHAIR